jgi:hypothetical protein
MSPHESVTSHARAAAGPVADGAVPTSQRAWFPPSADDFEITPEAAMYSGRR